MCVESSDVTKLFELPLVFLRIQVLKTSFEKNIYHSVDYEEHIFTSEVCFFLGLNF